jgi:ABC-2 type transport system permease protein
VTLRIIGGGLTVGISDFRTFWRNWRVWLMAHIMRVTTSAAMWILLGRLLDSEELVAFLLIGQIAIVGPQFAGWAVQAFTWDRMFIGTYPLLIAAPSSLVPIMLGRTLVWLLNGIATAFVTLLVLVPVFALPVTPAQLALWLTALILICASSYGLAFCLGSLINWIPRSRNVLQNISVIIMTAICGVVVPVAFWPPWVQALAAVLPVTHGLSAIRLMLAGGRPADVAVGFLLEAAVGAGWLAVGVLTLDRTVHAARRTGAIELN